MGASDKTVKLRVGGFSVVLLHSCFILRRLVSRNFSRHGSEMRELGFISLDKNLLT